MKILSVRLWPDEENFLQEVKKKEQFHMDTDAVHWIFGYVMAHMSQKSGSKPEKVKK